MALKPDSFYRATSARDAANSPNHTFCQNAALCGWLTTNSAIGEVADER